MISLCTTSVHVITATGQTWEQVSQSCSRISVPGDVSNTIGQGPGQPGPMCD